MSETSDTDAPTPDSPFRGLTGGEISAEQLAEFNAMLAEGPGDEATEAEVEAFMNRVLGTETGAAMIRDVAKQLTGDGLPEIFAEGGDDVEEIALPELASESHFVMRAEIAQTSPAIWRRISLPSDATFYHLHVALQDAFGWVGGKDHEFQIIEHGRVELTFSANGGESGENDYCEQQNRIIELFREGIVEFVYLYDFDDRWEHRILIEKVVAAGSEGVADVPRPAVMDGAGLCPVEGVGGSAGFAKFLKGEHELCADYGAEMVAKIREGEFDLSAVRFRQM